MSDLFDSNGSVSWIVDQPADNPTAALSIEPIEVLYSYDGPAIFTARVGFFDALFYKFEELDDSDFFLAVPIGKETLASLKEGALSLRGALESDEPAWVIEAHPDLSVIRWWPISNSVFPVRLLPTRRTAIRPGLGPAADSLDAANALFSLSFQGDSLGRAGMPLAAFRSLVDHAHDTARRILIPRVLAGMRSTTLDFQIAKPKFSSLVLALKQPLIDRLKIKRHLQRTQSTRKAEDVVAEIGKNSAAFVERVDDIASIASQGEISEAVALENFTLLDQISEIVPSEQNNLTELAIASNVDGSRSTVVIGSDAGERLQRARKLVDARLVTDSGAVIEVNGKQKTIIIESFRGREVTCVLDQHSFKMLRSANQLDIGVTIRVTGHFRRRRRRDLIVVSSPPEIVSS